MKPGGRTRTVRPPVLSDMNARGFTLIELVVILTLVGALALFVSARPSDRSAFQVRGWHDELVAATRYAQRYALASGCAVELDIAAGAYALNLLDSRPGCAATAVQRPDGGIFSGTAPAGISASGALGKHVFDARDDVGSGGTIAVTDGSMTLSFTISAGSGFVVAD